MKNNVQIDQYAEGYENGLLEANAESGKIVAALRAENAQLRNLLNALVAESAKMCHDFGREVRLVSQIQNAVNFLQDTSPDPLYLAAPEMAELLKRVWPYLKEWQIENYDEPGVGIFKDRELEDVYFAVKAVVEPAQPMYAAAKDDDILF